MRVPSLALFFAALASTTAHAKKPKPPPADAVAALRAGAPVLDFLAGVDALALDVPVHPELVGFTIDDKGGPMTVKGGTGWASLQQGLKAWGAEGGGITSTVKHLTCRPSGALAVCAAEYTQVLTTNGEPAGTLEVRGSFAYLWTDDAWTLVHWHESSPVAAP